MRKLSPVARVMQQKLINPIWTCTLLKKKKTPRNVILLLGIQYWDSSYLQYNEKWLAIISPTMINPTQFINPWLNLSSADEWREEFQMLTIYKPKKCNLGTRDPTLGQYLFIVQIKVDFLTGRLLQIRQSLIRNYIGLWHMSLGRSSEYRQCVSEGKRLSPTPTVSIFRNITVTRRRSVVTGTELQR